MSGEKLTLDSLGVLLLFALPFGLSVCSLVECRRQRLHFSHQYSGLFFQTRSVGSPGPGGIDHFGVLGLDPSLPLLSLLLFGFGSVVRCKPVAFVLPLSLAVWPECSCLFALKPAPFFLLIIHLFSSEKYGVQSAQHYADFVEPSI